MAVVEDLAAAIASFTELGLAPSSPQRVEGRWVDRVNGIDGVRVDIVMMKSQLLRPGQRERLPV